MHGRGMGLPSVTFTFNLPAELLTLVREEAERRGLTAGDIIKLSLADSVGRAFPQDARAKKLTKRIKQYYEVVCCATD